MADRCQVGRASSRHAVGPPGLVPYQQQIQMLQCYKCDHNTLLSFSFALRPYFTQNPSCSYSLSKVHLRFYRLCMPLTACLLLASLQARELDQQLVVSWSDAAAADVPLQAMTGFPDATAWLSDLSQRLDDAKALEQSSRQQVSDGQSRTLHALNKTGLRLHYQCVLSYRLDSCCPFSIT